MTQTHVTSSTWLSLLERGHVDPCEVNDLIGISLRQLRSQYQLVWPKLDQDRKGYPAQEAMTVALRLAQARKRRSFIATPGPVLSRVYQGRFDSAVADAAKAMLEINRYAKQNIFLRDEIYEVKNRFLEWLFERDHCIGWNHHEVIKPPKELGCYGCDGSGRCDSGGYSFAYDDDFDFDFDDDDDDDDDAQVGGDECGRCNGTGVYRTLPELRLEYVAFRFDIFGRRYTWHQPQDSVTWDYTTVPRYQDARDWDANDAPEPSAYKLSDDARVGLALVNWVMTEEGGDQ